MRRVYWLFLLFVLIAPLQACQDRKTQKVIKSQVRVPRTMQVKILRKIHYPNIPSASGLEIIQDKIYVVGDDSPFLYVLDAVSLQLVDKIKLFDTNFFTSGRIPKALKPDLECLTTITLAGQECLLAFGSGSAPTRNKCYTINLPAGATKAPKVKEYSLQHLYTQLQQDKNLMADDLLNIEAAATTPDNQLILLQRAALTGPNALIRFNTAEFTQYLTGNQKQVPAFNTLAFDLPNIHNIDARFSGAYVYNNRLFFTASVENTTDAILDGEVLGSFVGWLQISDIKPNATTAIPLHTALITDETGATYKGKIESLAIQRQEATNVYRGLAVTDNDNGESELLELLITL